MPTNKFFIIRFLSLIFLIISQAILGQNFSKEDTLRGANTQYRDFWNVKKYTISVEPDFQQKSLKGSNEILFDIVKNIENPVFQIDFKEPMQIQKIETRFPLSSKIERKGDFIFIHSRKKFKKGEKYTINIQFYGNPKIAEKAPWDGGWVFQTDLNGNPFASVAQQLTGASVWLPIKDFWADEPDEGILLTIITPKDLVGVGNGRLVSVIEKNEKKHYAWQVKSPINSYNISPNIGKFVNFKDVYHGEDGKLDLDYWVLDYNLDYAKEHFKQVKPMLKAFEYWFGAYPFYQDSYKMVETPYLGMEHQSNVAYGNNYSNGYMGRDLSGTGVGLKWDFIIIHETGHEWFGNSITAKDKADMWIHEAFTSYSETLFTEHYLSRTDAEKYVQGTRDNILNDKPIIAPYGVAQKGSNDMYYKGANMLHTIRYVMNDDFKFREILRGMNRDFYHKTVTTQQVENYISEKSGIDFSTVFNQYLRTVKVPILEYYKQGSALYFRYKDVVENLYLPIRINEKTTIVPTQDWQSVELENLAQFSFDKNYYIQYKEVKLNAR